MSVAGARDPVPRRRRRPSGQGVNFENLRDAGDPVELAARYNEEGADELTFPRRDGQQRRRDDDRRGQADR